MITKFQTFENIETETELIINDIIDYFDGDNKIIYDFIMKLFKFNTMVKVKCKNCTTMNDNRRIVTTIYKYSHKTHKGIIGGVGCVGKSGDKEIFLTLQFKRLKYDHEIDTNQPIIIYGNMPDDVKTIIDDINMKKCAKKYNL